MIFWIVTAFFALLPFITSWALADEAKYTGDSPVAKGIGGFFAGAFVGGILWLLVGVFGVGMLAHWGSTTEKTDTKVYTLTALETGNQTSGTFFLGSGRLDGTPVFSYLYQDKNGGYRLDTKRASNSVVYEDDSEKPRLEIDVYTTTPNPWIAPFLPLGETNKGENKFYVPEGSVLSNYQVTP